VQSDRHRKLRRGGIPAVALACIASLGLLAACGGGGGASKSSDLTVEEQVGFDGDAVLQRQARAENLIRDCMKAQGFDYVPVDPAAQQEALTGSRGLGKDEFEQQYGYGITTLYEERQQLAELGPNQAVYDALSPADQTAYTRTLYGEDPTQTFAVALDTGDFTRLGGCVKEAADTVFGGAQFFESLVAKLDELDQRVKNDPRVVAAIEKWVPCMRQAGYDLADPDQVDIILQDQLEAIVGPPDNRNPDFDRAALIALQREEVAMVTQDLVCEDKHIATIEEKVQTEYEREFREQNADVLAQVPKP